MASDFMVTVHGERAKDWEAVFGTTTLPVRAPHPYPASVPGKGFTMVYDLDLDLVTPEQRERLVGHLATRFGLTEREVERDIERQGVPLLAEDCSVAVQNPQRWM